MNEMDPEVDPSGPLGSPTANLDEKHADAAADEHSYAGERAISYPAGDASLNRQGEQPNEYSKLFVGQLPNSMSETELRQLFDPYGPVVDCAVLRDRITGLHKGCAFVTFSNAASAAAAIAALHDKVTLSASKRNLIVKFADRPVRTADAQDEVQSGDVKLFVAMLSRSTDEQRLRSIFEQFGPVKEVYLMRDMQNQSRGCAFVKYSSREHAIAAIGALHELFNDNGAPKNLIVKFAEHKNERGPSNRHGAAGGRGQFSFGGNSPQNFGPYQGGFNGGMNVGMGGYMNSPYNNMQSVQSLYSFSPTAGGGRGAVSMSPASTPYSQPPSPFSFQNMPQQAAQQMPQATGYNKAREARGPVGANLFVYNIPEFYQDGDLANLFVSFGTILSTRVFTDRVTGASKGFGFVSFASAQEAEQAIKVLNGYEISGRKLKVAHKKAGVGPAEYGAPY